MRVMITVVVVVYGGGGDGWDGHGWDGVRMMAMVYGGSGGIGGSNDYFQSRQIT